jgi:Cytochrome c554 and c-prime
MKSFGCQFARQFAQNVARLALVILAAPAVAQLGAAPPIMGPQPLPYQSLHQTQGTVTCASSLCHGSIKRWKDSNVLQNEYVTWSRTDKHAKAYNKLLNAQSQKIARNLGLKQPAHESKICLDCHAHSVPVDRHGERFKPTDGITCEACHGPAEKWIKTHVEPDASHARNVENGLYPTSDAASRAKMCLACHFGNKDKLVTHRIMGAGHPRMSFELDTFTEIAPKHFVIDKDYSERKQVWEGAKVWAIGQAYAVTDTMDILVDEKQGRDGLFPELVLFDCHACHHPMSEGRWKPKTAFGPSIAPGLVRLNDSNMLMLRALAYALDTGAGERISNQTRKLHRAVAGEGDARVEAMALKKVAADLVPLISERNLDINIIRAIALRLVDDGLSGYYSDYAAAEQAAMAISSVGSFLAKQGGMRNTAGFNESLRKLNVSLANDERYKPQEFMARLRDLRATLAK